jgi:cell division inhibitor SulA
MMAANINAVENNENAIRSCEIVTSVITWVRELNQERRRRLNCFVNQFVASLKDNVWQIINPRF